MRFMIHTAAPSEYLYERFISDGYVLICSNTSIQRRLGGEVIALANENGYNNLIAVETGQPNFVLCVINLDEYPNYEELKTKVEKQDINDDISN